MSKFDSDSFADPGDILFWKILGKMRIDRFTSLSEDEIVRAEATGTPFYGGNDGRLRGIGFPATRGIPSGNAHYSNQLTWFDHASGAVCRNAEVQTWFVFPRYGYGFGHGSSIPLAQTQTSTNFGPEVPMSKAVFDRVWDAACVRIAGSVAAYETKITQDAAETKVQMAELMARIDARLAEFRALPAAAAQPLPPKPEPLDHRTLAKHISVTLGAEYKEYKNDPSVVYVRQEDDKTGNGWNIMVFEDLRWLLNKITNGESSRIDEGQAKPENPLSAVFTRVTLQIPGVNP